MPERSNLLVTRTSILADRWNKYEWQAKAPHRTLCALFAEVKGIPVLPDACQCPNSAIMTTAFFVPGFVPVGNLYHSANTFLVLFPGTSRPGTERDRCTG
eukprot:3330468-Rhodomonas_salina.1